VTERELRSRVSAKLKLLDVSDDLWDEVQDEVSAALDGGKEEEADLVRWIRRLRRIGRQEILRHTLPPGRALLSKPEKIESAAEGVRADALSRWHAKIASTRRDVRWFRANILAGHTLTPADARRFLASPANRIYPLNMFKPEELPFLEVNCQVTEQVGDHPTLGPCNSISINPPGGMLRCGLDTRSPTEVLHYPGSDAYLDAVRFRPQSVVGMLMKLARSLAKSFPWPDHEAAWFVLTGEIPYVPVGTIRTSQGVYGGWSPGGSITLTLQPWASADSVLRAYRTVQKEMLGGRDNRPVSEKQAALFGFLVEQLIVHDDGGGTLLMHFQKSWQALVREWNNHCRESHPEWSYSDTDRRNFQRDYVRARDAIVRPRIVS